MNQPETKLTMAGLEEMVEHGYTYATYSELAKLLLDSQRALRYTTETLQELRKTIRVHWSVLDLIIQTGNQARLP